MTPVARVRTFGVAALAFAGLGVIAMLYFGIGGVERPPGSPPNPFGAMSSVEVGFVAFGAAMLAAIVTLVLARRLPPDERRAVLGWRIAAWIVVALPLVPPILFAAAMSTM